MAEKLQRTFVREEAYLKLRTWIVEGIFKPGLKLRDQELAAKLGVSRTPIREALLRLEDEGLVKSKANSATFVSPIDFSSAFDLYSIVWSLEKLALSQSFSLLTDEHIKIMIEANARLKQALKKGARLAALKADNDFHSAYIQPSQNKCLKDIIFKTKLKLTRFELYYFDNMKNAALSCEEHHRIIEVLQKKELEEALHAIECNWRASFTRIHPKDDHD